MTTKELLTKCLSTNIHGAIELKKEYSAQILFVNNWLTLHDDSYSYQILYHTGTGQTHNTLIVRPLGFATKEANGESFLVKREYRVSKTIDSDTLTKLVDEIFGGATV